MPLFHTKEWNIKSQVETRTDGGLSVEAFHLPFYKGSLWTSICMQRLYDCVALKMVFWCNFVRNEAQFNHYDQSDNLTVCWVNVYYTLVFPHNQKMDFEDYDSNYSLPFHNFCTFRSTMAWTTRRLHWTKRSRQFSTTTSGKWGVHETPLPLWGVLTWANLFPVNQELLSLTTKPWHTHCGHLREIPTDEDDRHAEKREFDSRIFSAPRHRNHAGSDATRAAVTSHLCRENLHQ